MWPRKVSLMHKSALFVARTLMPLKFISVYIGGRKLPPICKLSFFRILVSQQTSTTICKAHDSYYLTKIWQMPGISVHIDYFSAAVLWGRAQDVRLNFVAPEGGGCVHKISQAKLLFPFATQLIAACYTQEPVCPLNRRKLFLCLLLQELILIDSEFLYLQTQNHV